VIVRWLIAFGALALFSYGVLNVVTPRSTLAWQFRSAAPDGDALRRIRMLGAAEIIVAAVLAIVLIATA
jgi:hypothetical protein